jgi:hypothetical protein
MSAPATQAQIQVRWPGGKEKLYELPAGARAVELNMDGVTRLQ